MAIAFLAAGRSKDPATQVGACIVNSEKKIVGIGYNGLPIGCSDDAFPWTKTSEIDLENKYMYVCHAEINAILNKNSFDVKGCTLYVALFPCNECARSPLARPTSKQRRTLNDQSEQSGPAEPEPGSEARSAAGRRPEARPAAAGPEP